MRAHPFQNPALMVVGTVAALTVAEVLLRRLNYSDNVASDRDCPAVHGSGAISTPPDVASLTLRTECSRLSNTRPEPIRFRAVLRFTLEAHQAFES